MLNPSFQCKMLLINQQTNECVKLGSYPYVEATRGISIAYKILASVHTQQIYSPHEPYPFPDLIAGEALAGYYLLKEVIQGMNERKLCTCIECQLYEAKLDSIFAPYLQDMRAAPQDYLLALETEEICLDCYNDSEIEKGIEDYLESLNQIGNAQQTLDYMSEVKAQYPDNFDECIGLLQRR